MIAVESVIRDWLAGLFPAARVSTEAPAGIIGPTIRVTRTGGSSNWIVDRPLIDVDCWDLTRDGSRALAEQVRDAFNVLPRTTVSGLAVTEVHVFVGPRWLPWDNTTVRRFGATYVLTCTAAA